MLRSIVGISVFAAAVVGLTSPVGAVMREWDDGGPTKNWSDPLNWTGDTVPLPADDVFIGTLAAAKNKTVIFDPLSDVVASLEIVGGAKLDTDNGRLTVSGDTFVGAPFTGALTDAELIVRPTSVIGQPVALETGTLTVRDDGALSMRGGQISIRGNGAADGVLHTLLKSVIRGYGVINLDDDEIPEPNTPLLIHNGMMFVGDPDDDGMSEPPARILQINKPAALSWAHFQFDATITLLRNSTLDINDGSQSIGNFPIIDPGITMYANSRYDREFVTHIGSLIVQSGAVPLGPTTLPAAPAVISGGTFAQNCLDNQCSITTLSSDAELIFESMYNGGFGTVNNPGTIRFAGDASIGPNITFVPSGGTLVNDSGSTLVLYDAASVDTSLDNGGLIELGVDVPPKNNLGQVEVRDFTQLPDGELKIDIRGIASGDYDVMTVEGNAILDGTLSVELISNFMPIPGNSFTIIETTSGNVAGLFDHENMPVFDGHTFEVIYSPDFKSVALQVVDADLPGDFNTSGAVENADLTLLLNNWANPVPPTPAGWTGTPLTSPAVDNDELTALLNHWGTSAGAGSVRMGAVPELSTMGLAVWLGVLGTGRRYRVMSRGRRPATIRSAR